MRTFDATKIAVEADKAPVITSAIAKLTCINFLIFSCNVSSKNKKNMASIIPKTIVLSKDNRMTFIYTF